MQPIVKSKEKCFKKSGNDRNEEKNRVIKELARKLRKQLEMLS